MHLLRALWSGSDVGSHNAVQFVSLGMRAFKVLPEDYLKPARCRWRPCHESAELIGRAATKRRILLDRSSFIAFLRQRWMSVEELYRLDSSGRVTGLDECDAKPEMSVESLGGVLVGLWLRGNDAADTAETVPEQRVWIAGVLTGNRLESFADKAELTIALQVLEASDGEQ